MCTQCQDFFQSSSAASNDPNVEEKAGKKELTFEPRPFKGQAEIRMVELIRRVRRLVRYQNLIRAPMVPTTLRSLRIPASVWCTPTVLLAASSSFNEETLATDTWLHRIISCYTVCVGKPLREEAKDTVDAITSAAWLQMRAATALDAGLNALALACLCLVTYTCGFGAGVHSQLWPQVQLAD